MWLFELWFFQGICPVVELLVFLRNFHTILERGCTNSCSHQQYKKAFFSPQPPSIYCLEIFLIMLILIIVNDNLIIALICISPIMSDVELLFMCLLSISMSSLEKCQFRYSAHVLIGLFVFLILSCIIHLYIFEINRLSVVSFVILFSHPEGCLFILFIVSLAVQKLLSLIRFKLFIFVLISVTLGGGPRRSSCSLCQSVLPMFSSKSFIVSGFIFRYSFILSLFLYMVLESVRKFHSFTWSCPVF